MRQNLVIMLIVLHLPYRTIFYLSLPCPQGPGLTLWTVLSMQIIHNQSINENWGEFIVSQNARTSLAQGLPSPRKEGHQRSRVHRVVIYPQRACFTWLKYPFYNSHKTALLAQWLIDTAGSRSAVSVDTAGWQVCCLELGGHRWAQQSVPSLGRDAYP